jgi:hypothetical protein
MGVQAAVALFRGGPAPDPGVVIQLFAALGHCLIIVACVVAFLRTHPGSRQWGQFFAGGFLSLGYLLAASFTIGPPEAAEHIKQALGF